MIEQKLIVGRLINLPPRAVLRPNYLKGDFVSLQPLRLTVQQSTGLIEKTSRIIEGTGRREHRNFQWLEYFPGAITEIPLGKLDVLTGKMSGCWIVIYKKPPDGVLTVAHIGTEDSPQADGTVAVKNAWNTFAGSHSPGTIIAGFRPSDAWDFPFPTRTSEDSGGEIYGLVTANRELYSVFAYVQRGRNPHLLRIAGIKKMDSAEYNELRYL
jgi:hypothetical protein